MSKYKYICGMFTDDEDGYTIDCDDMAEEYNKLAKQLAELKAENEKLKEEIFKWQTQYASAYVHRQNALIAEKVELQQQLKDNTKQVCEKIRKELSNVGKTYFEDEPYIEICIVKDILDQIEKGES